MKSNFYQLIFITQKKNAPLSSYLRFMESCIQNGVTAVQLREKTLPFTELISFGKALKRLLSFYHLPLIVNDNLNLAMQLRADGIHLGQQDGDVMAIRKQWGADKIIGLTVNCERELLHANSLPVDYVGISAIFPTQNKHSIQHHWGIDKLQKAVAIKKKKAIAIGGITIHNAQKVMETGVEGIAAIGAFHDADNPAQSTKQFMEIINRRQDARCNQK